MDFKSDHLIQKELSLEEAIERMYPALSAEVDSSLAEDDVILILRGDPPSMAMCLHNLFHSVSSYVEAVEPTNDGAIKLHWSRRDIRK